mmetsp:Transcript_39432/g.95352  ORF Transcript_39432/g.95352 Transcript_39432/m.95352 type:complete len:320 (-) Transcript_39432:138-1097(-)
MSVGIFTEQVDDTREDGFEDQGRDSFPTIENDPIESADDADDAQDAGDVDEAEQNESEIEHHDTSSRVSLSGLNSISIISLQPIVRLPDESILCVDLPTSHIQLDMDTTSRDGTTYKENLITAVQKLSADNIPEEDRIYVHDVIPTVEGVTQLMVGFTEVPTSRDEYDLKYAKWMKLKKTLNGTALWRIMRDRITDIRNDLNESNLQNGTLLPPAIAAIDVQKLEDALKSLAKDHGQMDEDASSEFAKKAKPIVKKWWGNDQGTESSQSVKTHFLRRFHTDHVKSLTSLLRDTKNSWLDNYSGAAGLRRWLDEKKKTIA